MIEAIRFILFCFLLLFVRQKQPTAKVKILLTTGEDRGIYKKATF